MPTLQPGLKMIVPVDVTDAVLTATNVAETEHAAYNAGTTYAQGNRVQDASAGVHLIWESLINGNTGNDPHLAINADKWLKIGATNPWRAFDNSTGSQTTKADSFYFTVRPGAYIPSLFLGNVDAASIVVQYVDDVDGLVYDTTIYTSLTMLLGDWDSYFLDLVVAATDFFLNDLPLSAAGALTVTVNNAGKTAALGVFRMGRALALGLVHYGARITLNDWSVKTRDPWGGYTVEPGEFSLSGSFEVIVQKAVVDAVVVILRRYRAQLVVFIGSDDYRCTYLFGWPTSAEIGIDYPTESILNIDIENVPYLNE